MDKTNKRKVKKYHWVIVFFITVITTMYIYGMTEIYMPTPWYMGFGQYLDLSTGVVIISLIVMGFIIGILFKKNKK